VSRAEELSSARRALEIIQAPNRFIEQTLISHRFFSDPQKTIRRQPKALISS
jgi:hypothetical protein